MQVGRPWAMCDCHSCSAQKGERVLLFLLVLAVCKCSYVGTHEGRRVGIQVGRPWAICACHSCIVHKKENAFSFSCSL
jgi:hypothetical protein